MAILYFVLITSAARDPSGIGKPEPLRGDLTGYWSRRIDDANRLGYRVTDLELGIIACRFIMIINRDLCTK